MLDSKFLNKYIGSFLEEDGFYNNYQYIQSLPKNNVQCLLKLKSNLVLAGLPCFIECFNLYLDKKIDSNKYRDYEGNYFLSTENKEFEFTIPFNVALTLERVALNLVNRMTSIATTTRVLKEKLNNDIKILDTRKTTPGLRSFEKYAVLVGGGYNHRYNQLDVFMIKDNHKSFFGGLEPAVNFFKNQKLFYNSMVVEIHDLEELKIAFNLGLNHLMLDNFSKKDLERAISEKKPGVTYEVSGGINLENINEFDIKGIDALSIGMITQNPFKVDLSMKIKR